MEMVLSVFLGCSNHINKPFGPKKKNVLNMIRLFSLGNPQTASTAVASSRFLQNILYLRLTCENLEGI